RCFAGDVLRLGGQVLTGTPVSTVQRRRDDRVDVITPGGTHRLSRLVICAGLQAALVAPAARAPRSPEIVPLPPQYPPPPPPLPRRFPAPAPPRPRPGPAPHLPRA